MKITLSVKAKVLIAIIAIVFLAGGGIVGYKFYDFTQNNPKFCISCHLMKPAFDAWTVSEHKGINCHECHHLSIPEQNKLLITFVLHNPKAVPPRHGKIIVPWKFCVKCHWEKDERYPNAPSIGNSPLHAKHYFMNRIECTKCHGYITHKFIPEERFCIKCHEDREVHGSGMEALACLNCHTERTANLIPPREKCLFCHGPQAVRDRLIAEGTIDVKRYTPSEEIVKKAIKINVPSDAPMQFGCYECHKPHKKVRPDWGDCLRCHENIPSVGKHELHIKTLGMKCNQCHKPHIWKVTPSWAKKNCTTCHEYREPSRFIRG